MDDMHTLLRGLRASNGEGGDGGGQQQQLVLAAKGDLIRCLETPSQFYEYMLERVDRAERRITLSALYWGTGDMEQELVQRICNALQRNPSLQVHITLDHSRALRMGSSTGEVLSDDASRPRNSVEVLYPVLAAGAEPAPGAKAPRAVVSLYQMPQLQRPPARGIPSPLNETVAVSHVKLAVFDDDALLTGANLSTDYFTDRQDRYVVVPGAACRDLADLHVALAEALRPHCWTVAPQVRGQAKPELHKPVSWSWRENREGMRGLWVPKIGSPQHHEEKLKSALSGEE